MNGSTLSVAVLVIAMSTAGQTGPDGGTDEEDESARVWLAHTRRCMHKVFSIRATFVHEHLAKHRGEAEFWSGVAEVRRGGRYRLTYTEPKRRVVVSDGATVWAYDGQERAAYAGHAADPTLDALFDLLSKNDAEPVFNARWLSGARGPEEGAAAVELVPIAVHPFYASVVLTLASECPAVRRVIVTHHDGSVTRVTLSDIQTNVGMGKRRFTFTPPRGVRVVTP